MFNKNKNMHLDQWKSIRSSLFLSSVINNVELLAAFAGKKSSMCQRPMRQGIKKCITFCWQKRADCVLKMSCGSMWFYEMCNQPNCCPFCHHVGWWLAWCHPRLWCSPCHTFTWVCCAVTNNTAPAITDLWVATNHWHFAANLGLGVILMVLQCPKQGRFWFPLELALPSLPMVPNSSSVPPLTPLIQQMTSLPNPLHPVLMRGGQLLP